LLAASAIEHAISEFNANSNWETAYALGTEYPATPVAVGGGTFTWKLIDGAMADGVSTASAAWAMRPACSVSICSCRSAWTVGSLSEIDSK
jgi:hypothetical protein